MKELPPQKLSRRELRGLGIVVRGGQVTKINDTIFKVRSQSSNSIYTVVGIGEKWSCNCPDYSRKLKPCKHIHAISFIHGLSTIVDANSMVGQLQSDCTEQVKVDS